MSAGVKNLRAMFENKNSDQSTSPPSRGRSSPNGSVSSGNSRPVSKVRSSFVAVERPGEAGQPVQWGLRKQSDVSSMAEARDARPEAAKRQSLGNILKGSPFDDALPAEQPAPESQAPTATQATVPPKVNGNMSKVASATAKMNGTSSSSKLESSAKDSKIARAIPAALNTKATAPKPKDSPTLPKKSPALPKKSQDSPTVPNGTATALKPRGGISKIKGVMESATHAKEERAKAEQAKAESPKEEKKPALSVRPPPSASKPTAASRAHYQKEESPKEPSIKSPTSARSIKLPSVATAATAASKAHSQKQDLETPKSTTRDRTSLAPQAPRVANITTQASLAKKSSRASLANGDDRSKSRQSINHKPADEGFLARMTRPTAASASKAHDKVQVTSPPRPTARKVSEPKKPGRKSLNIGSRSHQATADSQIDQVDDTQLDPVTEAETPQRPQAAGVSSTGDDGEPGPAEEDATPQQAEAVGTTA